MTDKIKSTQVDILGKSYSIKCPEAEIDLLKKAAKHLEDKMQEIRMKTNIFQLDSLAVIAALNMAYEMMHVERDKAVYASSFEEKLLSLETQLDLWLEPKKELATAE